jgi:hemin uptake protein HemP
LLFVFRASFGINKPYTILDKVQPGGLIEIMKLSEESGANNQPLLKLC